MSEIFSERGKKALELDVRRKIYELVRKSAGSNFREIARKSNLPIGTARYHLHFLVKHDLISSEGSGKTIRYFPQGVSSDNKKLLSLLRQLSIRGILLFILTNNNCNHDQIVKSIKLSPSTVSWHLKKLANEDIIKSIKKGRKTVYLLNIDKEEIMKLLITYRESFIDSLVDNVIDMWNVD